MDLYYQSPKSIALKSNALTISINRPKRIKTSLRPHLFLQTFPIFDAPWWDSSDELEDDQRVFTGAGEYEKNGVHIRAFSTPIKIDSEALQATSYLIDMDGVLSLVLAPLTTDKQVKALTSSVSSAEVLVVFCNNEDDLKMRASDVGGAVAVLGVRVLALVGENEKLRNTIVKEVGGTKTSLGKYAVKKKHLVLNDVTIVVLE